MRAAHVTRLHSQVPERSAAGIRTPLPPPARSPPQDPIEPLRRETHTTKTTGGGRSALTVPQGTDRLLGVGAPPSVSVPLPGERRQQQFGGCAAHLPGAKEASSSPRAQPPRVRLSGAARGRTRRRMAGPSPRPRRGPGAPRRGSLPGPARPPGSAAPQPGGLGRAHARGAPGRAGHTPPTHSESLSLPALAPSPSGVSQSLPVAAGESLLPLRIRAAAVAPALRGDGDGDRETDSIKFPETTAQKGPRCGRLPVFPAPLQSLRDRCRWSGVGEPASRQPLLR